MKEDNQKDYVNTLVQGFLAFLSVFGIGVFLLIWIVTDNGVGFITASVLTLAQISAIVITIVSGATLLYNIKKDKDATS